MLAPGQRATDLNIIKKMNRLISFMSMCVVAIAVSAQQKADIEVSYSEISFYENGVERGNKYHLLANAVQSKFFNPRSEEIDSLTSTPEGLANFKKLRRQRCRL